MAPRQQLSENLKEKIRKALRAEASPKHVPAVILEVPDIPYSLNMKEVETAVANIVNNRPVTNRDALANPESLHFYTEILPLIHSHCSVSEGLRRTSRQFTSRSLSPS